MRGRFPRTTLIEEDAAVVGRVKVLPVRVLNAAARSAMEVDDRDTRGCAGLFPIDGVDGGDVKMT